MVLFFFNPKALQDKTLPRFCDCNGRRVRCGADFNSCAIIELCGKRTLILLRAQLNLENLIHQGFQAIAVAILLNPYQGLKLACAYFEM
jgi:hypothetical protein